jgi:hypothetical protein
MTFEMRKKETGEDEWKMSVFYLEGLGGREGMEWRVTLKVIT